MSQHFAVIGVRELVTGVRPALLEFPCPIDGQLNRIFARINAANPEGDVIFDLNLDGVSQYPTGAPRILAGEANMEVFPNIDVLKGQMVSIDLDSIPLGGVSGLYVIAELQDAPTLELYIKDGYAGAYAREPTSGELSAAVTALQGACIGAGDTIGATKTFWDALFTASEYTSLGTSNAVYVEDLYNAILGRRSDPGGFANWMATLTGGATRQAVRDGFTYSVEHINKRVNGWCAAALLQTNAIQLTGRSISGAAPTAGQVLAWDSTQWAPTTLDVLTSLFNFKKTARAATTGALPSYTSAVGVITATANGALPAQDGVTLAAGERLFVKDESGGNQKYNGVYAVTQVGDGTHPFVLTRTTDANTSAKVTANTLVPVAEGTVNKDTQWWLTTNDPITLDTTALTFSQFGKPSDPNLNYIWQSETPPQNGVHLKRFYAERNGTITGVRPATTLGDGTVTVQFDVLKNGVSIFPSSAKPSVPAGSYVNGSFLPDTTSFVDGDYFQINVVNNGNCIGPLRLMIIFKGA